MSEIACKYCNSKDIVKDGTNKNEQYFLCRSCNHRFNLRDALPYMKTPVEVVATAVGLFYDGLSLNEIVGQIKHIYGIEVSNFAVYYWVDRFTKYALKVTQYYRPNVGYVWMVDETVIDCAGKKRWLWDVIDIKTRFLLTSHLTTTRNIEDAQLILKQAYDRAGIIPKVIMTDSNPTYINAIKLVFGDKVKHTVSKKFAERPNNNIIERMQGTIKSRTKVMRGLKTMESAERILQGYLMNYNYFRPHSTLSTPDNDVTPAEQANARFPYKDWKTLIRHSLDKDRVPEFYKPVESLPIIKLTPKQYHKKYERYCQ